MGMNTVVVMLNDSTGRWPQEMARAMQSRDLPSHDGRFSCGQVISTAHASYTQVVAVGGNTGALLSPTTPAREDHLKALAEILRGHGYTVKAPGATRAQGPLNWGFSAEEARKARDAEKISEASGPETDTR